MRSSIRLLGPGLSQLIARAWRSLHCGNASRNQPPDCDQTPERWRQMVIASAGAPVARFAVAVFSHWPETRHGTDPLALASYARLSQSTEIGPAQADGCSTASSTTTSWPRCSSSYRTSFVRSLIAMRLALRRRVGFASRTGIGGDGCQPGVCTQATHALRRYRSALATLAP